MLDKNMSSPGGYQSFTALVTTNFQSGFSEGDDDRFQSLTNATVSDAMMPAAMTKLPT